MKRILVSSLIVLAGFVATLGLFGNGSVAYAAQPQVTQCAVLSDGVKQHGNVVVGTPKGDTIVCSNVPAGEGLRILGLSGSDLIVGGQGDDTIFGGSGDDTIQGLGGTDTINGGRGNDLVCDGEVVKNCEGQS